MGNARSAYEFSAAQQIYLNSFPAAWTFTSLTVSLWVMPYEYANH